LSHHRFYGDEVERRKWQNPDSILAAIGLNQGFTFIDVGCGDGFFSVPAAKIVGKKGRVFALDSDEETIALLKKKAFAENLVNVETIVGTAEDTVLCDACADIVFFSIVLHDFREPARVLANAMKMLKPEGLLVDLDWKKEPMDFGPPLSIRFSEKYAKGLIVDAGFKVEQQIEAGRFHYLIMARR
jgi:ubiquinone/menaquinone biosynthesis C-methylase UbiE